MLIIQIPQFALRSVNLIIEDQHWTHCQDRRSKDIDMRIPHYCIMLSGHYWIESEISKIVFTGYVIYLHFKCCSFSKLPLSKPPFHPPSLSSMRVLPHPPTHPLLHCPSILLRWGIKPPQDQGHLLPLMLNKAIFCYICSWSHEYLHEYTLISGLVPGSFGGLVGWYCRSFYGVTTHFRSFSPSPISSIGAALLSPMVGWEHLYWSGCGRVSQGTDIPCSCQQAFLGIINSA